jgi:retinoid hydroxylase
MSAPLSEAPVTQLGLIDMMSGAMPTLMAQEAERIGPIFRWQMSGGPDAGREIVFLIGAEANKMVFNTHRDVFSHDKGWTPIIGDMMGRGLLTQDNPAWTRSRKMWNPAFTTAYMERYIPLIQRIVAQHTANWAERGQVDVYQEAREITFHVAAGALAGIGRIDHVERLQRLFFALLPRTRIGNDEAAYEDYMHGAIAAKEELDAILLQLIAERRATPEDQTRDVLGMIVHAHDDQGLALTDDEVLAHLYILLVAGHETTTTLAAWTLYLLATEPEQRARVEAKLSTELAGSSAPLTVEAARNLHRLDLFIREVGRLHSPVQNVPRGMLGDVEFASYTIPVGAQVRVSLAGCHRMSRYFANPDTFDPDRFASPREEDRNSPYALVTFGGGPRLCIGVNFANIEVKAIATDVLRKFALTPAASERPFEIGFITEIMPGGIPMAVKPRR